MLHRVTIPVSLQTMHYTAVYHYTTCWFCLGFLILIRYMFQQSDNKNILVLWIHFQKTRLNTVSVNISQLNGTSSLKNSYKYRDYMTQNMIKEKMIMKKTIISVLRIFAVLQMTKYVVIASISSDPRQSRN